MSYILQGADEVQLARAIWYAWCLFTAPHLVSPKYHVSPCPERVSTEVIIIICIIIFRSERFGDIKELYPGIK